MDIIVELERSGVVFDLEPVFLARKERRVVMASVLNARDARAKELDAST